MTSLRIVSLVPSATETLVAWGRPPIACTRFCEQPDIAHVGGTKNPDVEAIVGCSPDLVVVDTEENRLEDHDALVERGLDVAVLSIRDVADLDPQMTALADRVGGSWTPIGPMPEPTVGVRAAVPIWRNPWMWLGTPTYATSLLRAAGIHNVLDEHGAYPTLELAAVAELSPDAVLAPDEPYSFGERHRAELETVARTTFVDGQDLVWWGARTAGALERLTELADQLRRDAGSWR